MKNIFSIIFSAFILTLTTSFFPITNIKLKLVVSGLTGPVAMECPKDGAKRIFICEQTGKIKIIKNGKVTSKAFLDVGSKLDGVNKIYSEKGLLGLAFHPKYKTNGKFYIYYSAPEKDKKFDHKGVVVQYTVSSNPDLADAASAKVILEIQQPESNHNGGQLAFGPDGFLYIGLGDGGGAGDKHGVKGNGQDMKTLLGKILRIDVDSKFPYAIPRDNPFINNKEARPEIWAYGLRNPWRFSFDRKTGLLFCADVGQNRLEEVDIIKKGKNYGWRIMEGTYCYDPKSGCKTAGLELPIAEYERSVGISVTGGYVYRGKNIPSLQGKYIFGDWKGKLFYLEEENKKWIFRNLSSDGRENDTRLNINSFGEDEDGEVYVLAQKTMGALISNGAVYLISQ
ncbi:MAG: glucose/sorbosone dehydrogenase [Bacteroidetes bacterium]|jgi:glucose/arabinose dehydrogenase|nr:glucose/sorbosone dehydrogenase [Bacteroidota bacterium]